MKRIPVASLLALIVAFALFGCGDFRRQAEEAQTRIASTEETAQVAEQAAARNTARILELEDRVDALEKQLAELCQGSAAQSE